MAATNDVTGDSIITTPSTQNYRDGYDRIFSGTKRDLDETIPEETSLGEDGAVPGSND